MTTKTYEKMKKELKQELMQEFVVPILKGVKDIEGEYKERFVKQVLDATKEKPVYTYNPETFLRYIDGK